MSVVFRFRTTYAKVGALRYISHRDLIQVLLRALRRAQIPMAYSQGFSPHPRVSFAPPLPLGVEGRHELLDLDLTRRQDEADFLAQANRAVPGGLRFETGENLLPGAASLAELVVRCRYELRPLAGAPEVLGARRPLEDLLAQTALPLERTRRKDGQTKVVDVRPLLHDLRPLPDGAVLAEVAAGEQTVTPFELAALLWPGLEGHPLEGLDIARTGFVGPAGQEL